jgi:hypothetical protein
LALLEESRLSQEVFVEALIEVFLSYAHEDEELAQQFKKHLSILQLQGLITWYDLDMTPPGVDWREDIKLHLDSAQIILILVSPDFLASNYSWEVMERALARHRTKTARVIPIILRPTFWKNTPLSKLRSLPRDGKAMTTWKSFDLAYLDVTRGIREAIEDAAANPSIALSKKGIEELDASTRNKFEELADELYTLNSYIRGYEHVVRYSNNLETKAEAQKTIERQSILSRHYLREYQTLANQQRVRIPPEIAQISARIGNPESRAS